MLPVFLQLYVNKGFMLPVFLQVYVNKGFMLPPSEVVFAHFLSVITPKFGLIRFLQIPKGNLFVQKLAIKAV
jgi:hypothetical protein